MNANRTDLSTRPLGIIIQIAKQETLILLRRRTLLITARLLSTLDKRAKRVIHSREFRGRRPRLSTTIHITIAGLDGG
jgi:hypothetical protein